MKGRIVIAGGTGFVGRALVRRLLDDGYEVTVLSRSPSRAEATLPVRCTVAGWDPPRPLQRRILRGACAVINLAGEGIADGRWTNARKQALHDSRVLSTRTIVQTLAGIPANERPPTLVSTSAIGYYGDRAATELDELAPAGDGFLPDLCRAWEREALAAERLGIRVVIPRIGVVLGREGGALPKLLPPFRLGLGGRLGSGRQWMSWIHIDDLVDLIRFVLGRDDVAGALNAVAPAAVTNRTFTSVLAGILGRPALIPVPAIGLRLLMGEMAVVLLASQRVVPRAVERLGFEFQHGRLAPALDELCRRRGREVEFEQWVPNGPAAVFPFFADPHNLERITPPFLRFRVLEASTDGLRAGSRIDYRLRLHGLPVRWQSRIEAWEPARRFVDVQTRGPYRHWRHEHTFEAHAGGTIVRDRVHYEVPLGTLGELVAGRFVARDVSSIFAFRRARLAELLGSGKQRTASGLEVAVSSIAAEMRATRNPSS